MNHLQLAQLHETAKTVRQANYGQLYIAGYGSLPGKPEPGLTPVGPGWIRNYQKDLCVSVTNCRGDALLPGRVAGLIPEVGARSMSMLTLAQGNEDDLMCRLAQRELNGLAYDPRVVTFDQATGESTLALAFAAAIWHPEIASETLTERARIVARASGTCGTNRAYLELCLAFEQDCFGTTTKSLSALHAEIERLQDSPRRSQRSGCYVQPTSQDMCACLALG
ncbi:MAG: gamma-glutamylcyclotransferase [Hyphomicrobiales bacterium]